MSAAAQVAMGVPKIVGLLCCGPATVLAGMQGAKIYRTLTATDEDKILNANSHKIGIVDRLQKQVGHFSEQQLDRLLLNNSAVQGSGDLLRQTRRDAIAEKDEHSVVKRTASTKFRKPCGAEKEEGITMSRTRSFRTAPGTGQQSLGA